MQFISVHFAHKDAFSLSLSLQEQDAFSISKLISEQPDTWLFIYDLEPMVHTNASPLTALNEKRLFGVVVR